jgi:hypothetical protein
MPVAISVPHDFVLQDNAVVGREKHLDTIRTG